MYAPQEPSCDVFSVLASSVIVIAAVPGFLWAFGISALGFRLHIPKLLTDTLFFRWCLLDKVVGGD